MTSQVGFVVFFCLMAAQASGASVSRAYPWHRADREHDSGSGGGPQARVPKAVRMLWHPA
jgi:hypothetical protein